VLSIKQRLADNQRIWIVLKILRLLVVYCRGSAIPQLGLVLLAQESLRLLRLCGELPDPFLFLLLILPNVVLRFEPRVGGWVGSGMFKAVVSTRRNTYVRAWIVFAAAVVLGIIETLAWVTIEAARKTPLVLIRVRLVLLGPSTLEWRSIELLLLRGIPLVIGLVRRVTSSHVRLTWHPFIRTRTPLGIAAVLLLTVGLALVKVVPLLLMIVAWRFKLTPIVVRWHSVVGPVVGALWALVRTWHKLMLWIVGPVILFWILVVEILIILGTAIAIKVVIASLGRHLLATRIVPVIWSLRILALVVLSLIWSVVVLWLLWAAIIILWRIVILPWLILSMIILLVTAKRRLVTKLIILLLLFESNGLVKHRPLLGLEAWTSNVAILIATIRRHREWVKCL